MVLRHRAHAVVREELGLVEHPGQHAVEALLAQQGEQRIVGAVLVVPARDQAGEVGPVGEDPLDALVEVGQPRQDVGVQELDGEQRDEPDHRAHPQRLLRPAGDLQHVVVEAVRLVPEPGAAGADLAVDGAGDQQEMLEELDRHVLVDMVDQRDLDRHSHEVQRVDRGPGGAVRLVDVAALRQQAAAVEQRDVVEAEEAALEDVAVVGVLLVHPPGEVEDQLVEDAAQERRVGLAAADAVDVVDLQRGQRVHRRVGVAELPLVGRQLAVGMEEARLGQQDQLRLGEGRIDQREGHAVEREVPRGEPGIFPGVRHRQDVGGDEMGPVRVAADAAARAAVAAR